MSTSYLVTGGAGFIGSHIVEVLVKQGKQVRILDNFSTGKQENIQNLVQKTDLIKGDLRNPEDCRKAVQGVDIIFHQGALPSVPISVSDPAGTNESNITGTVNLLIAARDAKIKRVVYAASSAVYGNNPDLPKVEGMMPEPLSPYAIQKYVGELYCQSFYALYGLETVALRYFNVFGPRQDPTSQYAAVIPKFISALVKGEAPTIYGDGEQTRDFIYVANVVKANLLAAEAKDAAGQVMNVACGKSYSLNELLKMLQKIMKVDIAATHTDPMPGDVKHSVADISKSQQLLDYKPIVSFEEGLAQTIDFFRRG